MSAEARPEGAGLLPRVIDVFLRGQLAPLLIAISLLAGLFALAVTAREEEPQIVVPMADVHVAAPGLSAEEVERKVATRVEKLLAQIDGVEHVYSASSPGRATVTVRFFVGEDREDSLVKIYNKLYSNTDRVPAAVTAWVVKPIEIDDVPIVIATLWSTVPEALDDHALRRIAEELELELQAVEGTNRVDVVGGRPRAVRVELDPDALAARRTSTLDVAWALGVSSVRESAGGFDHADAFTVVDAGDFLDGADALARLVVNVMDGVPVFLADVASILDGPDERVGYTWIGFGAGEGEPDRARPSLFFPAVHVAVAKQMGTNAVAVADRVVARIDEILSGLRAGERVYAPAPEAPGSDPRERAAVAVGAFREALGAALVQALAKGPGPAVDVCRSEAPRIAADLSRDGIRVGRTSHRLRNPSNAPEPWMVPLLEELRVAAPDPGASRTVSLGQRGLGYVEPIYVQPPCITCHGSGIEAPLLGHIRERYPDDEAVGFEVGDLRGLFWAVVAPPGPTTGTP